MGFKTNEFPAFYSQESGIKNLTSVSNEKEVVDIYLANKKAGLLSSVLVANPIKDEDEIPSEEINSIIELAIAEAKKLLISGKETTPFLLKLLKKKTKGKSLESNKSLALNNIKLGIEISKELNRVYENTTL